MTLDPTPTAAHGARWEVHHGLTGGTFAHGMTGRSDLSRQSTRNESRYVTMRALSVPVALFWAAAALVAGTTAYFAKGDLPAPPSWLEATLPSLITGALWIPLTLGVVWATRRSPPAVLVPSFRIRPAGLAGHAVASVLVTFLLNACYLGLTASTPWPGVAPFAGHVARTGLAFLHLNAGVYWVVVAGVLTVSALRWRSHDLNVDPGDRTLTVRTGSTSLRVRVDEIRWIEASGDYVSLHLQDTTHLLSERLKALEERLDGDTFVRVHRSAIVNVSTIRTLQHVGHGDYQLGLDDGTMVRVSRTRRARLQEVLARREVPAAGDGRL